MRPFRNEKLTDFTKSENKKKMMRALARVETQFGKEYSIIINGERIRLDNKFHSYNPSHKDQIVGTFQEADMPTADKAMTAALETFESWRFTPAKTRAQYLFRIAEIIAEDDFSFFGLMFGVSTSINCLTAKKEGVFSFSDNAPMHISTRNADLHT